MSGPFRAIAKHILRNKHPNNSIGGVAITTLGAPLGSKLVQKFLADRAANKNTAALVALVKDKPDSFLATHFRSIGAKDAKDGLQKIVSTSFVADKVKEIERSVGDPAMGMVAANRFALDNDIAKGLIADVMTKGTGGAAPFIGGILGGIAGGKAARLPGNLIQEARVERLAKNLRNGTLAGAGVAGGSALAYKKYQEKKAQAELDKEASFLGGAARLGRRALGTVTGRAWNSARAMSHEANLAAGGAGLLRPPTPVAQGFTDAAGQQIYQGTYAAGNAESIGKGLSTPHGLPFFRRPPKLQGAYVPAANGSYQPVTGGMHLEQGTQVYRRGDTAGQFVPSFTLDAPASIPAGAQLLPGRPAAPVQGNVIKAPAVQQQGTQQVAAKPRNPYQAGNVRSPPGQQPVAGQQPPPGQQPPDVPEQSLKDQFMELVNDPEVAGGIAGLFGGAASKASPWASIDWNKYMVPAGAAVGGGLLLSSAMNRNNGG